MNPRTNEPITVPTKRWTWFWSPERGYNPALRKVAQGQNGCYAVRDQNRTVLYVGESHTGRLWRTLIRHFQGLSSGKFEARNEWVWTDRDSVEVQLWIRLSGQAAMDLEAVLIERLRPTNESLSYHRDFDLLMGRTKDDEPVPF